MKQSLKSYLIAIISLLLFSFFSSLILTFVVTTKALNYRTSEIIMTILSFLSLAMISYLLSKKIKKHGLINALILSMLIISISLIGNQSVFELTNILFLISKVFIIFFFSILGVNRSLK